MGGARCACTRGRTREEGSACTRNHREDGAGAGAQLMALQGMILRDWWGKLIIFSVYVSYIFLVSGIFQRYPNSKMKYLTSMVYLISIFESLVISFPEILAHDDRWKRLHPIPVKISALIWVSGNFAQMGLDIFRHVPNVKMSMAQKWDAKKKARFGWSFWWCTWRKNPVNEANYVLIFKHRESRQTFGGGVLKEWSG